MELYFEPSGGMDQDIRTFPLSDRERDCLKGEVCEYCCQLTGMSLLEYGLLHWSEDSGPKPELMELTHPVETSASLPISDFDLMSLYVFHCLDQLAERALENMKSDQKEKKQL